MFGKKVSEAEYNELEQKYLSFECAYNNEHAKCSDLEQEVKELTDQIKRLKEAGNVLPEDLVKRAEDAESKAKELAELLEAEKSKNQDSEVNMQMLKTNEQLLAGNKQLYESTLRELEAEKTKNAELTAKLQTFSGGKTMADNQITQWEYKEMSANRIEEINEAGKEGWEATGNTTGHGILFKRPKQNPQRQQEPDYGYSR